MKITPSSGHGPAHFILLDVSANTSPQARSGHVEIGGQRAVIHQTAGEITYPSIFSDRDDTGWVLNGLGFIYDGFYPFVFIWNLGDWIYVWPEDAPTEWSGFYAFIFPRAHWAWTYRSIYPWYYPLGTPSGDPLRLD